MKNLSIGIIEVIGYTTAVACTDAMVKSAYIDVYDIKQIGSGMMTIIIHGELANVKEALEIGAEVASRYGELVAVRTIARPYDELYNLFSSVDKGDQS